MSTHSVSNITHWKGTEFVSNLELEHLSTKWKWGRLATLLASKSAQIKEDSKGKFQIGEGKENIKITKPIEIPPLQRVHVPGLSKVKGHDKKG